MMKISKILIAGPHSSDKYKKKFANDARQRSEIVLVETITSLVVRKAKAGSRQFSHSDLDGMGSTPAIPDARNVPFLLWHERLNEASLPVRNTSRIAAFKTLSFKSIEDKIDIDELYLASQWDEEFKFRLRLLKKRCWMVDAV